MMILQSKNIISKKLKAGSIFYALILTLLVGMISTAMISLTLSNKFFENKNDLNERIYQNSNSGIQLLLSEEAPKIEPFKMNLFDTEVGDISLEKKEWGLFSIAISKAFLEQKNDKYKHTVVSLLGQKPSLTEEAALYLENNDKPIVIVGDTYIKGDAFLPQAGVKPGNIDGIGYSGNELIYGNIHNSENQLPEINKNKSKYLLNQFDLGGYDQLKDSLQQSFTEETLIIREEIIILDDHFLKGNVILIADSIIYVDQYSRLEDIQLYAPNVFIEENTNGNFQAFATQLLDVEKNVRLNYPSVLGIIKTGLDKHEPQMNIGSESLIKGLIFVHNQMENKKYPKLFIDEFAIIKGQVFAECPVELLGDIHGNISCKSFFLRSGASSYSNHLLDNEINANKRSKHYVAPNLLSIKNKTAAIVKELQ